MGPAEAIARFVELASRRADLYTSVDEPGDARQAEVNLSLSAFYAANGRDYLNSPEHQALDKRLELSGRSKTVVVRDASGRLMSTVRLTPHPFESALLTPEQTSADRHGHHFELSRLVTWHGGELRTLPTALALGTALLQARSMGARGFVALARTPQRRVFAKFGLRPTHAAPVQVAAREGGDYWFLEAPIATVLETAQAYADQVLNALPSPRSPLTLESQFT